MRTTHIVGALALALLLSSGAGYVASAQETTTPTLEERVAELEATVVTLTEALDAAEARIEALEAKVVAAPVVKRDEIKERMVERGLGVAVCHNGKTNYVSIAALKGQLTAGALPGECGVANMFAHKYKWAEKFKGGDDDDDDDMDEDSDDDMDEDADDDMDEDSDDDMDEDADDADDDSTE